jgi:peptidoglycan/LPS O-acetylase OafA/YrhL
MASSPAARLSLPKYRPDIDGLRAVAVLAVIGFHAFPDRVRGGFVGVDVFFVISGYLITTILLASLAAGRFSFAEFYGRRIRRIFPALLLVLCACYAFGWFALWPDEYAQLGRHIAASAGFVTNFALWGESGYFDNAAETKPLLHLWSLGVEEQFYIVWPLLLWAAWKLRISLAAAIALTAAASFAAGIVVTGRDPVAAFYAPHTRFWELLIGAALAWLALREPRTGQMAAPAFASRLAPAADAAATRPGDAAAANLLSFAGVALIAFAIGTITEQSPFPGWWAVLPTLGAALVIRAGPHAWPNRTVLSHRLLVRIGLISFPLYLWHWPLLSFARIVESESPALEIRVAAVLASFLLAWLTYRLLERPIRFGGYPTAKTTVLVVLVAIVGYLGYNAHVRGGLAFRKHPAAEVLVPGEIGPVDFLRHPHGRYPLCTPAEILADALRWQQYVRCFQSKPDDRVDFALVGDSHAEHLFAGLAEALPARNVAFYIRDGAPFAGNRDFDAVLAHVTASRDIDTVILTMNWAARKRHVPAGSSLEAELAATATRLIDSGKTVYLTDDVPAFPFQPQKCKYARSFGLGRSTCTGGRDAMELRHREDIRALRGAIDIEPRLKLLGTWQYLCDDATCTMERDGRLLYRDDHHLNVEGSRYVACRLVEDHPVLRDRSAR